ncbi:TetR/AcrR family transcriptional regulator (plasmid) [Streptomyces sp. BI20]|uniref:TetR/AcrR family transcriptional regulator n=1 Tax=Streptomyces sp. BI20 TaxID=3403460 RepID=UPI003C72FC4B
MTPSVVPFGKPRAERADAVRNRVHLLETAREMIAEYGVESLTMDGLAERAGLGKGTVFRRFETRAGIFRALLDDVETRFQQQVLSGPPPLGPDADPVARLVAYGRARISFLLEHRAIARAGIDRNPSHPVVSVSQVHIRMLLGRARVPMPDLDGLAVQLTAALEGPVVLYLSMSEESGPPAGEVERLLTDSWQALIERIAR